MRGAKAHTCLGLIMLSYTALYSSFFKLMLLVLNMDVCLTLFSLHKAIYLSQSNFQHQK